MATGGRSSPDASSISDTLASFSTILNKTTLKLSDVKPEKQELELCSWIHNKRCVIISNVTPKPVKVFFFGLNAKCVYFSSRRIKIINSRLVLITNQCHYHDTLRQIFTICLFITSILIGFS